MTREDAAKVLIEYIKVQLDLITFEKNSQVQAEIAKDTLNAIKDFYNR